MMTSIFRFFALLTIPAMALAAVPPSLAVPDGAPLLLTARAQGVQIYACGVKEDAQHPVWTLTAPEAVLAAGERASIGRHYGGPTWELNDGSLVVGEVTARQAAPEATAIPWLLLKVVRNSGLGQLAAATAIQRIETVGGAAPAAPCQPGQELRVPYSATYLFYGGKR